MVHRKGQVSAVTVVLISAIVISLVGAAFMWGRPLIEKRTALTQFTAGERFMENLDKSITDLARSCSTEKQCEKSFTLPVGGMIYANETNNTIEYKIPVNQPLITQGEIPLNTGNVEGVASYGESPGVITVIGSKTSNGYYVAFRLRYRELYNSDQLKSYKIMLTAPGGRSGGVGSITVSYQGASVVPGGASNGGDLVATSIQVRAS